MRDSACPQTSGRRPAWKAGIVIAAFVSRVADRFHRGGCVRSRWPAIPLLALTLLAAGGGHAQPAPAPTFVPEASCGECHAAQQRAVAGSQHAHAMQPANPDTVLGNFEGATFRKDGVTSRFFRRDGRYFVNTDGPDGRLADYEIRFTFGVAPLQQYLVELPGGRLQAVSVTWDARPREQGGQRWFRQYPNEKVDHTDELHWTRRAQNWNFMCADCHSTNVRKGYDAAGNAFATQWSEISVGCESCHGPGSAHLAWAKDKPSSDPAKGLTVALDERRGAAWHGLATRRASPCAAYRARPNVK
jgi:hypothetical protein